MGVLLVGGGLLLWRQQKPETVEEQPSEQRGPLVVPPAAEEMTYETFQTTDGNLSFEYPSAWTRAEIKNLETVLPKNFVDKYQLTMPLILSDPRGAQASLSVYRFERGTDLNAVMDTLREDLVALGQPYNEVASQMEGEMMVVDSTVDAGQGVVVKVRDLLFLVPGSDKDTVYNLSFSAREPSWGNYEVIFNHIQTTAQPSF